MTVELTIEQFGNGIAITRNNPNDENQSLEKKVAKKCEEFETIGELIWQDIFNIFDKDNAEKVYLKIEYSKLY